MNGRIYDQNLGRFISADPFVQFPNSTQSYNRYSYLGNNPLNATDPSGYFLIPIVAAVAATYAKSVVVAAVIGAVSGYLATGTLKGAVIGAIGGAMAYGLNIAFEGATGWALASKSLIQGIGQGALSSAGGGRFGDGFLGGFAGGLSGFVPLPKGPMGAVIASMIGGTVTKIGGGSFKNGAITAAMVYALGNRQATQEKNKEYKPAETKGKTTVELSYTEIGAQPGADGKPFHHASIIIRPAEGDPIIISGAPTEGGGGLSQSALNTSGSADGAYGNLHVSGTYLENSYYSNIDVKSTLVVYATDQSAIEVFNQIANLGTAINQSNIQYSPLTTNSNAFAHQAVTVLGIPRPVPPIWAPGSGYQLNVGR